MLLTAMRIGCSALGEEAFEHGLRVLIDGTEAALLREGELAPQPLVTL